MLLLNILLAFAWALLTEEFTAFNLGFGFALGYVVLAVVAGVEEPAYSRKARRLVSFILFFWKELTIANLRVLRIVLSLRGDLHGQLRPAIIAVPLYVESDAEITMLANLITLTPGTLSLDVSTDRKSLYVHVMDVTDIEGFRQETQEGFERKVSEVFE
jgi:multicomponent Na+:H+ antiporter subunit E